MQPKRIFPFLGRKTSYIFQPRNGTKNRLQAVAKIMPVHGPSRLELSGMCSAVTWLKMLL